MYVCMMYFTSSHIFILELAGKSFDKCEGRRLVFFWIYEFSVPSISVISSSVYINLIQCPILGYKSFLS